MSDLEQKLRDLVCPGDWDNFHPLDRGFVDRQLVLARAAARLALEEAAALVDDEHDSNMALIATAKTTAVSTLCEERALVAARIADEVRALAEELR